MLKVGLTGGIGSGKTLVSDFFSQKGIDIVDADIVAREVVEPGTAQLQKIVSRYGNCMLLPNGKLDRAQLRNIIFNNLTEKQWLEELLHPIIREEINRRLASSNSPFTILVSPLLLETNQHSLVDIVVVVDAPETQQILRASARDHSNNEQIKQIIASQLSRKERLKHANKIIDNSGTITETLARCESLYAELLNESTRI